MRILVTGGSGAFGSAFVRTALTWPDVERIAVYARGEHRLEALSKSLGPDPRDRVRFFIGDVRDPRRLEMAMRGITHVVHAAALKIVPMGEYNPQEFTKTNVGGAEHVVDAAIRAGVKRVVALSTDKAVGPVNLYGATKLAAEKLFLAANALAGGSTTFSVVRYGNVTGSTGSVVPLWRPLAAKGEPLPLTDDRMTRYYMTLPEAVELVRTTMFRPDGGEVIIPKLASYKVIDLAKAVWAEQIPDDPWLYKVKAIGIRPGEKLHESMVSEDEAPWTWDCGDHYEIRQCYSAGPGGAAPEAIERGTKVPDGFRYRSDENEQWLTKEQMLKLLKTIP